LKKIKFHGLRHTNVSLMIAKGIQHQIISRKVGHSGVQVTDKFYSHFFDENLKILLMSWIMYFQRCNKIDEIFVMIPPIF